MTIGYNTEANIAALVQTIYEDAMLVARENALATSLVTVFNDRTGLAPRQNFTYGTVTINTVGEDDDLVSQVFTPSTDQTLTPAEAAAQFLLTDSRIETDFLPARADASRELGMGVADKIDVDIFSSVGENKSGGMGWAENLLPACQAVHIVGSNPAFKAGQPGKAGSPEFSSLYLCDYNLRAVKV